MNNTQKNQGNYRLLYWTPKFLLAVLLTVIGYKTPAAWLYVTASIWAGYVVSLLISPFLVAYSQDPEFAKIIRRMLSVLANVAAAALISAPVVMLHLYRISYFSNR